PILRALKEEREKGAGMPVCVRLVHTGQHFDPNMRERLIAQLEIPTPHAFLEAQGDTHARQTADIMVRFEAELTANRPDMVVVVGDVNSTLACALAAKKLSIPLAHVEAGLRSGDRSMPEEINRIATDSVSDYFFTTGEWADQNLLREGMPADSIFRVGNTMADTLLYSLPYARKPDFWARAGLKADRFLLLTIHRPSNADHPERMQAIIDAAAARSRGLPIVWPAHPRLKTHALALPPGLLLLPAQGYLEFLFLLSRCRAVLSDSGGVSEEATVLRKPCIVLRRVTERPETLESGACVLADADPQAIQSALDRLFEDDWPIASPPPLWDGKAGIRIAKALAHLSP
ncbi:MAG: non-hydrolyzing UDP-N-acetylglucosamine 2-epimerase, partial [Saprospiraceae bacterium]